MPLRSKGPPQIRKSRLSIDNKDPILNYCGDDHIEDPDCITICNNDEIATENAKYVQFCDEQFGIYCSRTDVDKARQDELCKCFRLPATKANICNPTCLDLSVVLSSQQRALCPRALEEEETSSWTTIGVPILITLSVLVLIIAIAMAIWKLR